MFIGDKTIVDIHGNTIVKVFAPDNTSKLKSNIVLFGGKVIVQMKETNNKKFILDAPSSTAIACVAFEKFNGGHKISINYLKKIQDMING